MNAISEAFQKVGIKAPNNKVRVWTTIKEEPGLTLDQLHKRLSSIPPGSVSSSLAIMEKRAMVYVKGAKGKKGRAVKSYYTDMDHYELLPEPMRNGATDSRPEPKPVISVATPTDPESLKRGPIQATKADDSVIDHLTIGEAKRLYAALKVFFK